MPKKVGPGELCNRSKQAKSSNPKSRHISVNCAIHPYPYPDHLPCYLFLCYVGFLICKASQTGLKDFIFKQVKAHGH